MAYIRISELPNLTSANLVSSGLSILPVVSNIAGNNITYQTTVANIKNYVGTGNLAVSGAVTANLTSTFANVTITGNLNVQGTTTTTSSQNLSTNSSIIDLHTFDSNLNPWTSDDGRDIGLRFFYYKSGAPGTSALVWENSTQYLTWYSSGVGNANTGAISGVYGTIHAGNLLLDGTSQATANATGALQVSGGISTGKDIYVTGNAIIGGAASISGITSTQANITTTGAVIADRHIANSAFWTNSYLYAGYVQTNNSGTFGTTLTVQGTATVNVLTSNGAVSGTTGTFTTSTITSALNAGTINANNTATVNSLTSNGAVSGTIGTFTTSTTTSALNTGTLNANSTATVASLTSNANITLGGNIIDTGALAIQTGSNGNINLEPNGTGVIVVTKDIRNGQANATGNIGSSTNYFNTVFAKATSAQYADLAEIYKADDIYSPGTVVIFGGTEEITITNTESDSRVAGAISTNPAYLMNTAAQGLAVALRGKVPLQIVGSVEKGDLLVTSNTSGYAVSTKHVTTYNPNAVFAKSITTDLGTEARTIWAVIL